MTASTVAAEIGVHPNVARHHLDKLAAGGYLEVVIGQGRRRRCRASLEALLRGRRARDERRDFPVRSDDLVLSLLGRALDRLSPDEAEQMAEEVGPGVRPGDGQPG